MNMGSPPTAPNARAGLLTPPGITPQARSNARWLLLRSGFMPFLRNQRLQFAWAKLNFAPCPSGGMLNYCRDRSRSGFPSQFLEQRFRLLNHRFQILMVAVQVNDALAKQPALS